MFDKQLLAVLAMGIVAVSAQAAPVALGSGAFLPADTLVDFNLASNEVAVGALYSGSGVTFSGALLGMTNSGDTNLFPGNGGGVIASNWNYSQGAHTGLSFTASFASLMSRVGFHLENWPNQTATVELFAGATSLGTLALANTSSLTAEFRGIGEASGFDKMVFTNTADTNGFFAVDDMRFSAAVPAIPEPETYALMLAGLAAVGFMVKRRKV